MSDLADLQKLLDRAVKEIPDKVLKIIGVEGKNFIQKNFRDEGFNDTGLEKWQERKDKDTSRAMLTGHATGGNKLRNSFKRRISLGSNTVTFYTYKDYAEVHNEGGKIVGNFKIREHLRKGRTGRIMRVKSHNRNVNTTIPKRQFMGKSAYLNTQISKKINKELDKILR